MNNQIQCKFITSAIHVCFVRSLQTYLAQLNVVWIVTAEMWAANLICFSNLS
jgi:hypothetical protein